MRTPIYTTLLTGLATLPFCAPVLAHDGRRFEIKVVDNQLVAHGYISDGVDDGGGVMRPYFNAIHGHFENKTNNFATADLPSFDVLDDADALIGHDLVMTITGFRKWSSPDTTGPVNLTPLDADESMEVVFGGESVASSGPLDPLTLLGNFNGSNGSDLDLSYDFFGDNPVGEIYVIQSVLTTTAPGVADSTTIYTILSPDGSTPMEKLHHASLFTEQALGTPIPEPAMLGLAALLPLLMCRRRA